MNGTKVRRIGIALAFAVCAASQAATQVTVQPQVGQPRDRPPAPITGTGAISGRVIDAVSGAPLPRARVRLQGGGGPRPSIVTDATGRFAFRDLPRGPFSVSVEKSTYLATRYPEPGRTLRTQTNMLTLGDGQAIADLTVPLFHGSAITGRVVDPHGDPVEYAEVRVLRIPAAGGRATMRGGSSTNDIGEFRAARLEPGTYLLMAVPRRTGPDEMSLGVTPTAITLPTYYPGTLGMDQAQPITIARGQTVSDVEITLADGVPAIVSGTIVGEDGQPVSAGGYVMARSVVRDMQMPVDAGSTSARPDGTFQMALAPGEYVFEARANARSGGGPGVVRGTVIGLGNAMAGPDGERFGTARVSVGGNVDGLTIAVGAGATASGRIVFDGTSPLPPVPPAGQFRLPLSSPDGPGCRQGRTTVTQDWTFQVEGLGGTCSAAPQMPLGNWVLKSVMVNEQDLLHETITFETGQRLRNVQVIFTDRRGGMSFTVTDDAGQTTTEYAALAFPVSSGRGPAMGVRPFVPPNAAMLAMRNSSGPPTSAVPSRGPNLTTLNGLAAGEYYAIALDDIGIEDWRDPAVLARLIPAATRVTVGDTPLTQVMLRRQALDDILKR